MQIGQVDTADGKNPRMTLAWLFPALHIKFWVCTLLAEELEEISGHLLVKLSAPPGPPRASHPGPEPGGVLKFLRMETPQILGAANPSHPLLIRKRLQSFHYAQLGVFSLERSPS